MFSYIRDYAVGYDILGPLKSVIHYLAKLLTGKQNLLPKALVIDFSWRFHSLNMC